MRNVTLMTYGNVTIKDTDGYIDTADQAKLIRQQLKRVHPGTKFSVRISRYAGGSSIRVNWTDGPTTDSVDGAIAAYAGGGFDGMTDYAYSVQTWLMPDGSVTFGRCSNGGTNGTYDYEPPVPNARLVRFCGNYVFSNRDHSRQAVQVALDSVVASYGFTDKGYELNEYDWIINDHDRPIEHCPLSIGQLVSDKMENRNFFTEEACQ